MHPNPMADTFRSTPKMREFTVKCLLASIVLIEMMIMRILLKGVGLSAMLPAQSEAVTE